jgi:hypothetical protein
MRTSGEVEGLVRDHDSGHYQVLSGYGYYANLFRIHETWLDEDDNLWIDGSAVERVLRENGTDGFDAQLTKNNHSNNHSGSANAA